MASCDIFCTVVDHFGDIGVSWRLARQLSDEYGWRVRLWVDDLRAFARLCADIDPHAPRQTIGTVIVERWHQDIDWNLRDIEVADVVIEAFACGPPPAYIAAMAQCARCTPGCRAARIFGGCQCTRGVLGCAWIAGSSARRNGRLTLFIRKCGAGAITDRMARRDCAGHLHRTRRHRFRRHCSLPKSAIAGGGNSDDARTSDALRRAICST